MYWTPAQDEKLTQLVADGMSYGGIALEIGCITRNAAIGRANRLGLHTKFPRTTTSSYSPIRAQLERDRIRIKQAKQHSIVIVPPAPVETKPRNLTLIQLTERTCKFPVTDEPPHLFCGHKSVEGKPYCGFHERRAHGPYRMADA